MVAGTILLLCISALVSGSEVAFFSLTPKELSRMRESTASRDKAIFLVDSDPDGDAKPVQMFHNKGNWMNPAMSK